MTIKTAEKKSKSFFMNKALTELIDLAGLTTTQLGTMAGVNHVHVMRIRNNQSDVGGEILYNCLNAIEEVQPGSKLYFGARLSGYSEQEAKTMMLLTTANQGDEQLAMDMVVKIIQNLKIDQVAEVLAVATAVIKNKIGNNDANNTRRASDLVGAAGR